MDTVLFITDLHVGAHVPELAGVFDRAAAHRWRVIEIEHARTTRPLRELIERWRPAGCIMEGSLGASRSTERTFRNIPVVHLDPDPRMARTARHTVSSDARRLAQMAVRELGNTAPRSYAYIGWCTKTVWSTERGHVFTEHVKTETGKAVVLFDAGWDMGDLHGAQKKIARFLAELPRPVGIFATNDYTAVQVADACASLGWTSPTDFSLVSVDNEELHCESATPSITSIEQDFRGGGRLAADLLAELIANPDLEPRHLTFGPVRLVRRQSTRALKINDSRITRAVERIRRDATLGISAADILAEIPLSRRLAEKRFLAATGKTILEEIQDVRLEKVFHLLKTDIPIGHIAARCGLQSDSFLKRFFKAKTGLTLREWRQQNKS